MLPEMLPTRPAPEYFDRKLTLRGVGIHLRVFPQAGQFFYETTRTLTPQETRSFMLYMKSEGFLEAPDGGDQEVYA